MIRILQNRDRTYTICFGALPLIKGLTFRQAIRCSSGPLRHFRDQASRPRQRFRLVLKRKRLGDLGEQSPPFHVTEADACGEAIRASCYSAALNASAPLR
jgi:hypothetical protein